MYPLKMNSFLFLAFPFISICYILGSCSTTEAASDEDAEGFSRVSYNNPDLEVDLGVGLWAWPLPMDFDKDGILDMVVACPDKPYNGIYLFNRSASDPELFQPAERISDGAKNLQVSFIDGEPRVLGPGVEYRNFRESLLSDPVDLFPSDSLDKDFEKIRFRQWKYVDYDDDQDLDIIVGIDEWGEYGWDNAFNDDGVWTNGPLHGYLYLLENIDGEYVNHGRMKAGGEVIDLYGAPTPNIDDFDGDGDLDIICGEFLDRLTWFENSGSREEPVYEKGKFLKNADGIIHMDLEMIIPVSIDWDKDGDPDLIVGDEDGRVALIENTGEIEDGMPAFASPVYLKQKANNVKFGALVTPYSTDWDDDGDEDLICGNTAGYIGFIENLGGGEQPQWAAPVRLSAEGETIRIQAGYNGSIQGPAEAKWGYTTVSVADWNGDGLKDIIANSIWGKTVWYENTGTSSEPILKKAQPVLVDWGDDAIPKPAWNWWDPTANELSTQWRTTPQAYDWNQDGMMDLIMLDHEGYLSYYERKETNDGFLKLQPGKRIFYSVNDAEFGDKKEEMDGEPGLIRNSRLYGGSGRRKWCFVDWDRDGDMDIIVNSTNAALYENTGEKDGLVQYRNRGDFTDQLLAGHTTSPTVVDWNKDGWPDLLLGAEDGFLYYLDNPNAR